MGAAVDSWLNRDARQGSLNTSPAEQLLRRYAQFFNLGDIESQQGDSRYHAMQMRFVKRFRAGGAVQASYKWSKLLSDTDTLTSWLEAGRCDQLCRAFDSSLKQNQFRGTRREKLSTGPFTNSAFPSPWASVESCAMHLAC